MAMAISSGSEVSASILVAIPLAASGPSPHAPGIFIVSETEAAAIRAAFDQGNLGAIFAGSDGGVTSGRVVPALIAQAVEQWLEQAG
jgi:hypothetical protein